MLSRIWQGERTQANAEILKTSNAEITEKSHTNRQNVLPNWHQNCGFSVYMAQRRNRDLDTASGLAGLFMLVVLLWTVLPSARALMVGIGIIIFELALLAGIVALVVFLFRGGSWKNAHHHVHVDSPQLWTPPELIAQLRALDWFQFEKIVGLAYRKLGFTVTRRGGANPDGGIDLLISKDGVTKAVQCKQWKAWNVGVKAVREFLGAMTDARLDRGIFVTVCGYTGEARQLAEKHGIEILDETGLARILGSVDATYDPEVLALLRDQRKFCPRCESEMVQRTAKKGGRAGGKFWGCSAYPRCRYTMPA